MFDFGANAEEEELEFNFEDEIPAYFAGKLALLPKFFGVTEELFYQVFEYYFYDVSKVGSKFSNEEREAKLLRRIGLPKTAKKNETLLLSSVESENENECQNCHNMVKENDLLCLVCGHFFCKDCWIENLVVNHSNCCLKDNCKCKVAPKDLYYFCPDSNPEFLTEMAKEHARIERVFKFKLKKSLKYIQGLEFHSESQEKNVDINDNDNDIHENRNSHEDDTYIHSKSENNNSNNCAYEKNDQNALELECSVCSSILDIKFARFGVAYCTQCSSLTCIYCGEKCHFPLSCRENTNFKKILLKYSSKKMDLKRFLIEEKKRKLKLRKISQINEIVSQCFNSEDDSVFSHIENNFANYSSVQKIHENIFNNKVIIGKIIDINENFENFRQRFPKIGEFFANEMNDKPNKDKNYKQLFAEIDKDNQFLSLFNVFNDFSVLDFEEPKPIIVQTKLGNSINISDDALNDKEEMIDLNDKEEMINLNDIEGTIKYNDDENEKALKKEKIVNESIEIMTILSLNSYKKAFLNIMRNHKNIEFLKNLVEKIDQLLFEEEEGLRTVDLQYFCILLHYFSA